MAKKEKIEKDPASEDPMLQRQPLRLSVRRNGFRAGDILLVVLAVTVTALMIFLGAKVIPAVRESFSSYSEELLFTVEYPLSLTDTLPQAGDGWVLLDSDGTICTVRMVEFSEEEGICRVMLLRKNAVFREGEGYSIGDTRVSVGSTLYFHGVSDRYFAATVLSLESDRFAPLVHDSESEDTDEAEDAEIEEDENE